MADSSSSVARLASARPPWPGTWLRKRRRAARCVLTGHCYDLTNTPPYGPWLDLAATYPPDPALPAPPAAFAGGILERVTDQAALFAEVRRFFAELSSTRPILVLLEDLHWADPASLELLRHVAPHLRQWSILLLATYRVDELTRRHPFSQQLPALVREAEGLRLDLRRLDARCPAQRSSQPATVSRPRTKRVSSSIWISTLTATRSSRPRSCAH